MHRTPSRSYRQLQPEDRVTLASLVQQKPGIREMASALNRSPSTISRELRRNRGVQSYASAQAGQQCALRRKAARPAINLHTDALLFDVVCHVTHSPTVRG